MGGLLAATLGLECAGQRATQPQVAARGNGQCAMEELVQFCTLLWVFINIDAAAAVV